MRIFLASLICALGLVVSAQAETSDLGFHEKRVESFTSGSNEKQDISALQDSALTERANVVEAKATLFPTVLDAQTVSAGVDSVAASGTPTPLPMSLILFCGALGGLMLLGHLRSRGYKEY